MSTPVTFRFTPRTVHAIRDTADRTGQTQVDTVARAVALYGRIAEADHALMSGEYDVARITFENPYGAMADHTLFVEVRTSTPPVLFEEEDDVSWWRRIANKAITKHNIVFGSGILTGVVLTGAVCMLVPPWVPVAVGWTLAGLGIGAILLAGRGDRS